MLLTTTNWHCRPCIMHEWLASCGCGRGPRDHLALGSVRLSHATRFGSWAMPRRRSGSAGPALNETRQPPARGGHKRRGEVMRHGLRRGLREGGGYRRDHRGPDRGEGSPEGGVPEGRHRAEQRLSRNSGSGTVLPMTAPSPWARGNRSSMRDGRVLGKQRRELIQHGPLEAFVG